jgi:hypothetical protein
MPSHIVEDDLAAGRLARLEPAAWDGFSAPPRLALVAAHRRDRSLGVAGDWLFRRLTDRAAPG